MTNTNASALAHIRWKKTTREQRVEYAKMMNRASQRARKARKNGLKRPVRKPIDIRK